MKKSHLALLIIFLVLTADQVLKIFIKTNMMLGDEFGIFGLNWARIHFTENEGMAFGMVLGGEYGKLFLTLFRLVAVTFIGYYLFTLIRQNANTGLIVSIALIFSGAMGNIIDSVFYGVIFQDSIYNVSTIFPEGGGYAALLHGHVVDMFYFPMFKGYYPEWFPIVGGKYFVFFRPVFNLADSAITIGVFSILIFQRGVFVHKHVDSAKDAALEKDES